MTEAHVEEGRKWKQILAPYKKPSNRKATVQVLNTLIPFLLLWYLAYRSLAVSYWITLALAIPASGFLIRLFILQHDCGHAAFFKSRRVNNVLGSILGVLTLTPYHYWRRSHADHHATTGDLDHRGMGEVETLTVNEYRNASWARRLGYRLYRNGFVLLVVGPFFQFAVKHRIPWDCPRSWKKEWRGVLWTDLGIAAVVGALWWAIGLKSFLLVHGPIFLISGALGVWLFYVQHQFEDTYWEEHKHWDFTTASLQGSSFYDLPAVIHWFTGNIGYHHIHHLSSKVPNYNLRRCSRENPELNQVTRIKFWESLKCLRLKLWDEENRKLVGFRELRSMAA